MKWMPRVYFRFLGRNKSSEYCIWFEDYDDKKIIETPLSTGKYICTSMRSNVIRYYPSLIRQVFKNRRNLVREMKYVSSPPKLTSGVASMSFLGRRSIGEPISRSSRSTEDSLQISLLPYQQIISIRLSMIYCYYLGCSKIDYRIQKSFRIDWTYTKLSTKDYTNLSLYH